MPCLVPSPDHFHPSSFCAVQIESFSLAVPCCWDPCFSRARAAHDPFLPFCFTPTKDKDFGKQALRKEHVNPPAEVSTSLKTYQHFTLEKAYLREDFFWAFTPTAGDFIRFRFFKPLRIERPVLGQGSAVGDVGTAWSMQRHFPFALLAHVEFLARLLLGCPRGGSGALPGGG